MKLVVLALVLLPSGGAARAPEGDWSNAQMRKGMDAFGRCLVERRAASARQFILQSWAPFNGIDDLMETCLEVTAGAGTLKFPGPMLKMIVADVLVRRDYGQAMPDIANRKLPVFEPPAPTQKELKWRANPRKAAEVAKVDASRAVAEYQATVGECIARANPRSTYELLMSEPGSKVEQVRLQPLTAILPKCVPEAISSVDPMSFRGNLALAFYRLANAPMVPAAGVPHA